MSFETLRPLFLLAIVGVLFRGFLAALILPSGVDEGVMLDVAPVVTLERAAGRSGTLSDEGLEGKGGEDGDGLSKGVSLSSPSGVVMGESAMAEGDERRGELDDRVVACSAGGAEEVREERRAGGGGSNRQAIGQQSGDDASRGERGRRSSELWVL